MIPVETVYVFDIDYTLAIPGRTPYVEDYLPCESIVRLARFLKGIHHGATVAIVTARAESLRKGTEYWLRSQGIPYSLLLMRAEDDYRPDEQVRVDQINRVRETFRPREIFLYDDKIENCKAVEYHTGTPCVLVTAYRNPL